MKRSIPEYSIVFIVACLLNILINITPASAWGPIAHYELTKMALNDSEIAKCAQIPDYQASYEKYQNYYGSIVIMGVSPYFCWGHGVQDRGTVFSLGIPLTPFYTGNASEPGKYPGPVMWHLIQTKFNTVSEEKRELLEKIVRGFRAHNAADRVVHFTYFKGALPNYNIYQAADAWMFNHAAKEKWADYFIYIMVHFDSNYKLAFNWAGLLNIVDEYKNAGGIPIFGRHNNFSYDPNLNYMADLMRQAQLVYRKNRFQTNRNEPTAQFEPQSVDEIIMSYVNSVLNDTNNYHLYNDYYFIDFLYLESLAVRNGWYDNAPLIFDVIDAAKESIMNWNENLDQENTINFSRNSELDKIASKYETRTDSNNIKGFNDAKDTPISESRFINEISRVLMEIIVDTLI